MKSRLFFFMFMSLSFLNISCQKEEDEFIQNNGEGILVFGHFYGECAGEYCIEIFRLTEDELFEDTNDQYPDGTDFYEGNFSEELSDQLFTEVSDLKNSFPAELWDEAGKVIGQPDAGDWGGVYVEYQKGEQHDFWLLDQQKSNMPEAYHAFVDAVNAKIQLLQP